MYSLPLQMNKLYLPPLFRRSLIVSIVAMGLASFGGVVDAQTQTIDFRFADLAWGSSPEVVRDTLVNKGYKVVRTDANGDIFSGTIADGVDAEIKCEYTQESELVEVDITPTKDSYAALAQVSPLLAQ
jgi:hypothetical protein